MEATLSTLCWHCQAVDRPALLGAKAPLKIASVSKSVSNKFVNSSIPVGDRGNLKPFFETDSEESDIYVGSEHVDIMGGNEKAFDHILVMRKRYLKLLEKYDEIEDDDKRDVFKKYVKLKGKLWGEWYDVKEDGEEGGKGDGEDNDRDEESEGDEQQAGSGTSTETEK